MSPFEWGAGIMPVACSSAFTAVRIDDAMRYTAERDV